MGLDMYAFSVKKENRIDTFHIKHDENVKELHYVEISLKDLEDLEYDIRNHTLPETMGFFFGKDE